MSVMWKRQKLLRDNADSLEFNEGRNSLCDMLDVLVQKASDKCGHVGNGENNMGITEDGWRRGQKGPEVRGIFSQCLMWKK